MAGVEAGVRDEREAYRRAVIEQVTSALEARLDLTAGSGAAPPAPEAVAQAVVDLLWPMPSDNPLVTLLAPFWSSAKVRDALGIRTRQALDSRIASGSILAVRTDDGRLLFPVNQFTRVGDGIAVREGMARMFSVLRDQDPWTVALLMVTPAEELDGATPLAWCRAEGNIARLERLAEQVRREWAA